MRYILTLISISLIFIIGCNEEQPDLFLENPPQTGDWQLTFEDNFDGNQFDAPSPIKWETQNYNRRNNDLGPDGWWSENDVYLGGDGNLVIRVEQIQNNNNDSDPFDYSVGMVRSKGKFEQKFGKFEIRCQLPRHAGWWVAFWLFSEGVGNVDNSGEDGTEIDIMEGFGWTNSVQHALHFDGYSSDHQSEGQRVTLDGIRDGFHTFTLEWNEDEYIFFIDDKETWRTNFGGVSKVPAYLKITGEISTEEWATSNGWANEINNDDFPDYFYVDYVKVYKK